MPNVTHKSTDYKSHTCTFNINDVKKWLILDQHQKRKDLLSLQTEGSTEQFEISEKYRIYQTHHIIVILMIKLTK